MLCAFDLIEVDGKDLRSGPIEERKHVLAEILHPERKAIVFNSTTTVTAQRSSSTPARSAVRASYRNGSAHRIVRAGLRIG